MMHTASFLAGKRVLTVDDSSTIRTFIRGILGAYGARVDEAETGAAGLEHARSGDYDLILLDLVLPDMDGISVLREIRQTTERSAIVMLTGVGGVKSAIASVHAGADGFIQKEDISLSDNLDEFIYHLEQAMKRRAGLVAEKELERMRRDFYAMVTHDLRSPATTASLALEVLQELLVDAEAPEVVELVETMQESIDRLLNLINDYLVYSEIESGYLQLDRSRVDLCALLESSVRLAGMQARAKGQEMHVHIPKEPIEAWVDGHRIKQVFDNLIGNAVKYTPDGGVIHVRLGKEDNEVVFQVEDNGMGLTPEQIRVLFNRYQRGGRQAERLIQGTGLGLAIVKEIVEAHGGAVRAMSPGPGQGSTFTVRVPVQAPEEGQQSNGHRSQAA